MAQKQQNDGRLQIPQICLPTIMSRTKYNNSQCISSRTSRSSRLSAFNPLQLEDKSKRSVAAEQISPQGLAVQEINIKVLKDVLIRSGRSDCCNREFLDPYYSNLSDSLELSEQDHILVCRLNVLVNLLAESFAALKTLEKKFTRCQEKAPSIDTKLDELWAMCRSQTLAYSSSVFLRQNADTYQIGAKQLVAKMYREYYEEKYRPSLK